MLGDSGRAVSQKFRHNFQANSPVQAPGSIGVSCDVGEDRLVYPKEVTGGLIGGLRKRDL